MLQLKPERDISEPINMMNCDQQVLLKPLLNCTCDIYCGPFVSTILTACPAAYFTFTPGIAEESSN